MGGSGGGGRKEWCVCVCGQGEIGMGLASLMRRCACSLTFASVGKFACLFACL